MYRRCIKECKLFFNFAILKFITRDNILLRPSSWVFSSEICKVLVSYQDNPLSLCPLLASLPCCTDAKPSALRPIATQHNPLSQ